MIQSSPTWVRSRTLTTETPCRISCGVFKSIFQWLLVCHGRSFTFLLHHFIFCLSPHHKPCDRLMMDIKFSPRRYPPPTAALLQSYHQPASEQRLLREPCSKQQTGAAWQSFKMAEMNTVYYHSSHLHFVPAAWMLQSVCVRVELL